MQSGLWIDNQQRYDQLVSSNRFTLSFAFKRAGWRTVADVPSNENDWHWGSSFYHYDKIYDRRNIGYAGPTFSYAAMPDQYILSAFQRTELAKPNHAPVMAEIDLVSSHTPWAPLPHMIDWNKVGDGSVFDGMPEAGQSPNAVWRNAQHVQAAYGQSIEYSLSALISFVQTFHDNNLVLVLLGDHQPATIVSGSGASHDVPITIIAHDPKVLDRISSWGWQDGMLPEPAGAGVADGLVPRPVPERVRQRPDGGSRVGARPLRVSAFSLLAVRTGYRRSYGQDRSKLSSWPAPGC